MVLISSFLTGSFLTGYDRSKLIYEHLNDGDKVRECYSCLQLMIQPHLPVGFSEIFFRKHISCKRFFFAIKKICKVANFCKFKKNVIVTQRIVTIEKHELAFLPIL